MRYTFSDCELDTEIRAIRRGDVQRTLRPKPFQVLLYLLEQRHRVVSKQERVVPIGVREN
jgi:DNA-binding winged helix-turn-helix (wHTH) protein